MAVATRQGRSRYPECRTGSWLNNSNKALSAAEFRALLSSFVPVMHVNDEWNQMDRADEPLPVLFTLEEAMEFEK